MPKTRREFPDTLDYDAVAQRLEIGTGYIDRVPPAVWAYEVSGKQVLRQRVCDGPLIPASKVA